MAFKTGDAVVHPIRGAGVVEWVEERRWRGDSDVYYKINLLGQPGTKVMIPKDAAEEIGLRPAISLAKLGDVWGVLGDDPEKLPTDHKVRYKVVEEKLHTGNVLKLAEAVRDMAWRRQEKGHLTTTGKRLYDEGVKLLAGEVAAVQGVDVMDAEVQVKARLREGIAVSAAA
jgi:CarD family transcriptional regulator